MSLLTTAQKVRKPEAKINSLLYSRWSPRAMTGESLTQEELLPLFEAARWAPSSFNGQPWRFIIATGNQKEKFMDFLIDFNKQWCKNSAALVIILSQNNFEYNEEPNRNHSFDTGAAWENLALEGASRNLVVHGMAGFDAEKVKKTLKIPPNYTVEAMCAIGKLAPPTVLPKDIAEKETPSTRKSVKEIVSWDGTFMWK